MSDFTIKNLKQVDDALKERDSGVEARFARKHLDSDHLGVSYIRFGPHARFPSATATASRRRPTWSSPAPGGSVSTTRSRRSASGT